MADAIIHSTGNLLMPFNIKLVKRWESGTSTFTITLDKPTPIILCIPEYGGAASIIPADGYNVNISYVWNGGSTSNFDNGVFTLSTDGLTFTCTAVGATNWKQYWRFYAIEY